MTNKTLHYSCENAHPNSLWQIILKYIGTKTKECLLAMIYWYSITLMQEQSPMLLQLLDMMLL